MTKVQVKITRKADGIQIELMSQNFAQEAFVTTPYLEHTNDGSYTMDITEFAMEYAKAHTELMIGELKPLTGEIMSFESGRAYGYNFAKQDIRDRNNAN